jgi:hypothetical protein
VFSATAAKPLPSRTQPECPPRLNVRGGRRWAAGRRHRQPISVARSYAVLMLSGAPKPQLPAPARYPRRAPSDYLAPGMSSSAESRNAVNGYPSVLPRGANDYSSVTARSAAPPIDQPVRPETVPRDVQHGRLFACRRPQAGACPRLTPERLTTHHRRQMHHRWRALVGFAVLTLVVNIAGPRAHMHPADHDQAGRALVHSHGVGEPHSHDQAPATAGDERESHGTVVALGAAAVLLSSSWSATLTAPLFLPEPVATITTVDAWTPAPRTGPGRSHDPPSDLLPARAPPLGLLQIS